MKFGQDWKVQLVQAHKLIWQDILANFIILLYNFEVLFIVTEFDAEHPS